MKTATRSIPTLTESDKNRFWSKVDKDGPLPDQSNPHYEGLDKCWTWMASYRNKKYGCFRILNKTHQSHRISFLIHHGAISECVCHRCDNPSCINPSHLFAGSNQDNLRDMINKGRGGDFSSMGLKRNQNPNSFAKGSDNGRSKLIESDVVEIRQLSLNGLTAVQIAGIFGVDPSNIRCILRRVTWKHVL